MKKAALGIIAIAALIGTPALAADMALKAAPPPPPAFSWTGFYLGGFVGGAGTGSVSTPDGTNAVTVGAYPPGVPTICDGGTPGLKTGCVANYGLNSSVIGGVTAGYNWQVGNLVTGLEGEFGYQHLSGSGLLPYIGGAPCGSAPTSPCNTTMSTRIGDSYGVLAARLGVTSNALHAGWSDHVLLYAKVGAAVSGAATSESIAAAPPTYPLPSTLAGSSTVWGVAAGGGVEWALNHHWSLKAEYEFLGFNKSVSGCAVLPYGVNGAGGTWCTQTSIGGVQTGKVGVNFHF